MKPAQNTRPIYTIRTQREVAKLLGISRRQVQIAEAEAFRKLRVALESQAVGVAR